MITSFSSWVLKPSFFLALISFPLKGFSAPLAKSTYFTGKLLEILSSWPPPAISIQDNRPVTIRGIRVPGYPDTVGIIKHSKVRVPLDKVIQLTEQFSEYPKFWEDVLSVTAKPQDENHIITEWVRKAPAFFLKKIRYRVLYTIDKSIPGRAVYRQQLIDGNQIKSSDNLVVLENLEKEMTRISVISFFEPDIGAFRSFVEGKIWRRSIENFFKDDIAFQTKLDHPDWSLDQITEVSEHTLDRYPIKEILFTDTFQFKK